MSPDPLTRTRIDQLYSRTPSRKPLVIVLGGVAADEMKGLNTEHGSEASSERLADVEASAFSTLESSRDSSAERGWRRGVCR